jgi:type II secretory pathway predicted ATPase ExeA
MSNYDHLCPHAAELLDLDPEARMDRIVQDVFIKHDRLQGILDHVEYLRFERPRSRASGLAVVGQPGSGKTFLAQVIQRLYSGTPANEVSPASVPIVLINMTGARDAKTIYNRLLEALGCPDSSIYRGSDRERRALRLCRAADVRMLIVDELGDLMNSTDRQCTIALETIKTIMNELAIPVLALGVAKVRETLERDEHLNARFTFMELPVWQDDKYLQRFLQAYEQELPLKKPSLLHMPGIRKALLECSKGSLTKLVRYLTWAAAYAIEDGTEFVTPELIAKAVQKPPKAAIALRRRQEEARLADKAKAA